MNKYIDCSDFEKKLYTVQKFPNFRELIINSATKFGNRNAFQIKDNNNSYRFVTYNELKTRYYNLCSVFLHMGLSGKRIAVIGKNSFSWVLSYLAASTAGIAVPIDKELGAEDIDAFIKAAGCSAVCADKSIIDNLTLNSSDDMNYMTFSEVEKLSQKDCGKDTVRIDSIPILDDEMRVLIFTSGTTGSSKGVCLSQKNICSNIYSTSRMVKINPNDKTLSILPLHHTYECTLDCLMLLSRGACISYCDGLTKIPQNLAEYQPTILVVVPALLNVLSKRIRKAIANECPAKYKPLYENYEKISLAQALKVTPFILRKLICLKVKNSLGGKLRRIIVGAADLEPSLVEDFTALGIRTLQGYGLTECAPLVAGNNDFILNPESVGRTIPGVELKILNPNESGIGEIAVRGDNVMLGYYNDDAATSAVIKDGYFHTGDMGYIDEEGFLYIKGRIKNVIVTSNGKNIYPEELETRLSQIPVIGEVLVLASDENGEVCVKAKILPNLDFLKEKLGSLPSFEEIRTAVDNAIKEVNSRIPSYKHIRIVEILTDKLEKTTTQKIKRFGANLT